MTSAHDSIQKLVLVVDDDPDIRMLLGEALESSGYRVEVAADGTQALVFLANCTPDLVMLDAIMPGIDGFAVCARLHEFPGNEAIPVVMMVGNNDLVSIRRAYEQGAIDFLSKPINMGEIGYRVNFILRTAKAFSALKTNESKMVDALKIAKVGNWEFELESQHIYLSVEARHILRADSLADDTSYLSFINIIHPDDRMQVEKVLTKAIKHNNCYSIDHKLRHLDGTTSFVHTEGQVIRNHAGIPIRLEGTIQDISDRKIAEEKLKKTYLQLKERHGFIESIFTNIQSGIIVIDLDFRIKLINPSAQRCLDVSAAEVTGQDINVLCPEFAKALRSNRSIDEIQCSVCAKEHVIGYRKINLKGNNESVNGYIITFADLAEIVKIRKEIKLKERLANMGEFVAQVAHEIRNPLFGMTAICQIFAMELHLSNEHKKLMDTMMKETLRLKNIVDELLDCSKELTIVKNSCDFAKIIDDTIFEMRILFAKKKISIEKNITGDNFVIEADKYKITQLIVNLVKNAYESSPEYGVIRILMQKEKGNMLFSIHDSGTGIPENKLDKIFDVFFTTKRYGTGLGLAICKNIAAAHGGSLLARNSAEGGAIFVFSLPAT